MERYVFSAEGLAIGYDRATKREKRLYEGLHFGLRRGTLTCLIGPNGAGKSTLLRTLSGSQPPLSGKLMLEGRPLEAYSRTELSRTLGLVLTDRIHAGGLRVREVIALGRYPHSGFFGRLSAQDLQIVDQALSMAGVSHKADSYMAELSDGERQKVMIAKALAQECPVVVLDEPTAFLDVSSRIEVMNLLHDLARGGRTILLSTHDIEQALMLADRLWLLSPAQGMVCGTTEDMVLRGEIGRFFDSEAIAFEPVRGKFLLRGQPHWRVRLDAEGALRYWTENLLTRNGFGVSDEEDCRYRIRVRAADHLEFSDRETAHSESLDSFEALERCLRGISGRRE